MNRLNQFSLILLSSLLVLLVSCSKPSRDDYFPLEKGATWTYSVRVKKSTGLTQTRMVITATGAGSYPDSNGKEQTARVRHTSEGTDYYIAKTPQGYERVAKRVVVQFAPVADKDPRLILPLGQHLRVGYTWTVQSHPFVMAWKAPFAEMNGSLKPFNMVYQIASLNDTIHTPAGKFEHCVRVDAEGKVTIYADPSSGYHEVQITQKEWYAPGVGLIRVERNEPLEMDIIKGGSAVLQLIDFKP